MKTNRRYDPRPAARRTAQLWEQTVHSVADLIAVVDRDQRILQVNRPLAAKLGRTPQQCVGQRCYRCIHGTRRPPPICPHPRSLADGQAHTAAVHAPRLGGCFLVTTSPLRGDADQRIGCVHVARDITQQHDQAVLRHLWQDSEHQRQLIHCELHDGLAQQLAGALMHFEAYDRLKEPSPAQATKAHALGRQLVAHAHAEARRLIAGLRPPQLAAGGLLAAIAGLVADAKQRSGVPITFRHRLATLPLTPMLENTIFRVVQECLANACRHSHSQRVKVVLTQHDDQLRIAVRDWGVGFDVARVPPGHFGLAGIHQRAHVLGGSAVINSGPRQGTDIVVELPLHPAAAGGWPVPTGQRTRFPRQTRRRRGASHSGGKPR